MEDYKLQEILKQNEIEPLRCELYFQFIKRLTFHIFDTYLGDDCMKAEDYQKHFDWCLSKANSEFTIESFDFNDIEISRYFYKFFYNIFYKSEFKSLQMEKIVWDIWDNTFIKNTKLINLLLMVEIYKIMENVFHKKIDFINIK